MANWWWTRSAAVFRWPESVGSYIFGGGRSSWDRQSILRDWETLTVSIVDDVVWKLITAVESVALVSMFCFFFLFCGCTV